jgi:predicted lipid-binding transport protein (Tim44 family)
VLELISRPSTQRRLELDSTQHEHLRGKLRVIRFGHLALGGCHSALGSCLMRSSGNVSASDRHPAAAEGSAMRLNTSMTGVVIPGLIAGVIYAVIAGVTGASAVAAIIGALLVAAVAIGIGFIFRSIFKRRAGSRRK